MSYPAFPGSVDVLRLISSTGIVDVTGNGFRSIDLDSFVRSSVSEVQSRSGRIFIAVSATRSYDVPTGPHGIIDLGADLCSGGSAPTILLNGVSQEVGTQVFLDPVNADVDGVPWVRIDIPVLCYAFGIYPRRCVSVSGLWGYSVSVPDDVWAGVVCHAAHLAVPTLQLMISQGVCELRTEEGVAAYLDGGKSALTVADASWMSEFDGVCSRYRRVTI